MERLKVWVKGHGNEMVQLVAIAFLVFACNHIQLQLLSALEDTYEQHIGFRIWLPFCLVGICFVLFLNRKWIAVSVGYLCFYLILVIDQLYFSFFGTMPAVGQKIPLTQGVEVADSVFSLFQTHHLIGLVYFFVLLGYGILFFKSASKQPRVFKRFLLGRLAGVGMLILSGVWVLLAASHPIPEKNHQVWKPVKRLPFEHWGARFSSVDYTKVFGAPIYHTKDFFKYFNKKKPEPLSQSEIARYSSQLMEVRKADGQGPLYGIAKDANVIAIQLESFQHWLIDLKIDGVEVTPFLNRLYKEQLHWNNIYDVAGLGRTSDAEFAFNTGILPSSEKASSFNDFSKDIFAFPQTLRADGYQTYSFHGYKKDFWNRTNTHPFFGISQMMFIESFPKVPKLGLGIPDKVIMPQIAAQLAKKEDPYYAFIISLSCHFPYIDLPEDVKGRFSSLDNRPELLYLPGYIKLANYTDQAIELFFHEMNQRQLLDNTLVAIYGDHDFNTSGISTSSMKTFSTAAVEIVGFDPMVAGQDKVPLAIWMPEKIRAQVPDLNLSAYETVPGTLCDIFPTVFHLLGREVPCGVLGSHLFSPDRVAFPLPKFFDTGTWSVGFRVYDHSGLYFLRGGSSEYYNLTASPVATTSTPAALVRKATILSHINFRMVEANQQKVFRELRSNGK